jgi:tripartite-type tricarboxylate transporter receptor subunit TctC
VQAGKLKVLGVSKATRMPLLANVPTIAEQGVKGFESGTWQGALMPAKTPPAVIARISAELTRIIRSPEIRERLVSQGAEVHTMTPADFSTFFERERKNWATVVAQGGVKVQ